MGKALFSHCLIPRKGLKAIGVVTFHGICNFHDVSFHIYLILSNFNLIISPFVYLYGVTLFDK